VSVELIGLLSLMGIFSIDFSDEKFLKRGFAAPKMNFLVENS